MIPSFWIGSAWHSLCSAIGAGVGAQLVACPSCEPVLHCPAVACHCGGVTTGPSPLSAAAGWSGSFVAGAFVAGIFFGLVLTWQLRVWAQGEWASAGRVGLAQPARAQWTEPSLGPLLRGPSTSSTPLTNTSLGGDASPSGEVAVWQPRRR